MKSLNVYINNTFRLASSLLKLKNTSVTTAQKLNFLHKTFVDRSPYVAEDGLELWSSYLLSSGITDVCHHTFVTLNGHSFSLFYIHLFILCV